MFSTFEEGCPKELAMLSRREDRDSRRIKQDIEVVMTKDSEYSEDVASLQGPLKHETLISLNICVS